MKCLHFGKHRGFGRVKKLLAFNISEHVMGYGMGVGPGHVQNLYIGETCYNIVVGRVG